MKKPLRNYSRRELKEGLESRSQNAQYEYHNFESELRRRESNCMTKLMTAAVVCNAALILVDILIRVFGTPTAQ